MANEGNSNRGRAEIRANDVRENLREEPGRLTRRRHINTDKYAIPEQFKREGFSYEWKRRTNVGAVDMEHQVMLSENHWQPVQAKDMPGLMPADYDGVIERGGQILMCRPEYLTQEAYQEVLDISQERVRTQERRLGLTNQGEAPRTRPSINREYIPFTKADRVMAKGQTIPD